MQQSPIRDLRIYPESTGRFPVWTDQCGQRRILPPGLNYGWLGEINLQYTLDKLLEGDFGCGYPPEDAVRKKRDTAVLKQINRVSKRPAIEVFPSLDRNLVRKALQWNAVRENILQNGQNDDVFEMIKSIIDDMYPDEQGM